MLFSKYAAIIIVGIFRFEILDKRGTADQVWRLMFRRLELDIAER